VQAGHALSNMIKSILPYDVERGGQKIQLLDLSIFQNKQQNALNKYLQAKAEEIQSEYNNLLEIYKWNEYVMSFKINFEPTVGKTYYLYQATTNFISILSPKELTTCKCVGSAKLTSDNYWIKS
jgi:hypothetical protein